VPDEKNGLKDFSPPHPGSDYFQGMRAKIFKFPSVEALLAKRPFLAVFAAVFHHAGEELQVKFLWDCEEISLKY
jgi:hypothetical protein